MSGFTNPLVPLGVLGDPKRDCAIREQYVPTTFQASGNLVSDASADEHRVF